MLSLPVRSCVDIWDDDLRFLPAGALPETSPSGKIHRIQSQNAWVTENVPDQRGLRSGRKEHLLIDIFAKHRSTINLK